MASNLIKQHEHHIKEANSTKQKDRPKFLDDSECKPLRMKLYLQQQDKSIQVNCSAMHYCGTRYGPQKHLYKTGY